jgi:hypothetical protein
MFTTVLVQPRIQHEVLPHHVSKRRSLQPNQAAVFFIELVGKCSTKPAIHGLVCFHLLFYQTHILFSIMILFILMLLVPSLVFVTFVLLLAYRRKQKHLQYLQRINWLEINHIGYGANARKRLRNHCSWNEIAAWERMVTLEEINYPLLTKLENFYGKKS